MKIQVFLMDFHKILKSFHISIYFHSIFFLTGFHIEIKREKQRLQRRTKEDIVFFNFF